MAKQVIDQDTNETDSAPAIEVIYPISFSGEEIAELFSTTRNNDYLDRTAATLFLQARWGDKAMSYAKIVNLSKALNADETPNTDRAFTLHKVFENPKRNSDKDPTFEGISIIDLLSWVPSQGSRYFSKCRIGAMLKGISVNKSDFDKLYDLLIANGFATEEDRKTNSTAMKLEATETVE